jgi:transcriptional regulator with XRE-family HTH domain
VATIGQILRDAREGRQLTTSKAAADTNIKIQHIEAMERDDFSHMAAPIYAKGFIRIYAEYLGVDPAPLIAEYMEKYAPRERPPLLVPEYERRETPETPPSGAGAASVDWHALRARLLEGAGRAAPWVAGAVAVALVAWGGARWVRRARERAAAKAVAVEAPAAPVERKRMELPLIAEPPEPYLETGSAVSGERLP